MYLLSTCPSLFPLVCFLIFFFLSEYSTQIFCFPAFLWAFLRLLYNAIIYCPLIFRHSFPSRHFCPALKCDFSNVFSLGSIHFYNYHSIFFLPVSVSLEFTGHSFSLNFSLFLAFTRRIKEGRFYCCCFLTENQFLWRIWSFPLMYSKIECSIETGYFSI